MDVFVINHGSYIEVRVNEKRIDKSIAQQFRDKLKELVELKPPAMLIDLTQVEFIDSSGLGAIITGQKLIGKSSRLTICGVRDSVAQLFSLTKLNKVLNIKENCKE